MKFIEAKQKLKELAKGRYHRLEYTLTEFDGGKIEETFSVYTDAWSFGGTSWESCLKRLDIQLNPEIKPPLEGMPE